MNAFPIHQIIGHDSKLILDRIFIFSITLHSVSFPERIDVPSAFGSVVFVTVVVVVVDRNVTFDRWQIKLPLSVCVWGWVAGRGTRCAIGKQ